MRALLVRVRALKWLRFRVQSSLPNLNLTPVLCVALCGALCCVSCNACVPQRVGLCQRINTQPVALPTTGGSGFMSRMEWCFSHACMRLDRTGRLAESGGASARGLFGSALTLRKSFRPYNLLRACSLWKTTFYAASCISSAFISASSASDRNSHPNLRPLLMAFSTACRLRLRGLP
jgi:hypothetical protein